MGWRIRKSIGLGKLLRVNLSKSGVSVSAGVPGARINVGKNVRLTTGIPGTGISHTQVISSSPRSGTRRSGSGHNVSGVIESDLPLVPVKPKHGALNTLLVFTWVPIFSLMTLVSLFQDSSSKLMVVGWFLFCAPLLWERYSKNREAERTNALIAQRNEDARREALELEEHQRKIRLRFGTHADDFMAGKPWLECPESVVFEMFGQPEATEEKVSRVKTTKVLKFFGEGANRFLLRVEVEGGVVVGWEDRR